MATIKEKWKNIRIAKKAKKAAKREIVVTSDKRPDNVCLVNEVQQVPDSWKYDDYPFPMIKVRRCKHFLKDQVCNNVDCPMHKENAQYIATCAKYKQARAEFLNILFRRWRKKSLEQIQQNSKATGK